MNHVPDENQLEELFQNSLPGPSARLDRRLAHAPWTPPAVARRRAAAILISALFTLAVLTAATPQGRAFAQNLLRFFTRSQSQVVTLPTVESTLVAAAPVIQPTATPQPAATEEPGCGTELSPQCTLEEVRQRVDFPVREFQSLPDELRFAGASLTPQGGALLYYRGQIGDLKLAQIPLAQDSWEQWQVGPDASVESVAIGDQWGEYVQGAWLGLGLQEPGSIGWDSEIPIQTLRWSEDGLQYTLWLVPARSGQPAPKLDKGRLVELAAALRLPSESAVRPTVPESTVEQAGALAGLTVVQPPNLPTGFTLSKAVYSPAWNAVCLYYRYHPDEPYPALVVFESAGALPGLQDIQTKSYYNGAEVEIASQVESLPVGGADGGLGTLFTTGLDSSQLCGDEQAPANRALLWRSGGLSYALFAYLDQLDGRGFLSKLEMRQLAESLNGQPTTSAAEIDPERLTSVASAEQLSGMKVRAPALMLANLHLDHIAYLDNADGPYPADGAERRIALLYTGQPVGDGRAYKLLVIQTSNPANTLENLALAGGYQPVTVRGQPGIYQQSCWDTPGYDTGCMSLLTWFEGGQQFDLEAFLPAALPQETLLAIAESLR